MPEPGNRRNSPCRRPATWEGVALDALAYEFSAADRREAEEKIKRRLRRHQLGAWDTDRVEACRKLKDELRDEIARFDASPYFTGRHGRYSEMEDFDVPRLAADLAARHPRVPLAEIEWFVPFCVFLYHLR